MSTIFVPGVPMVHRRRFGTGSRRAATKAKAWQVAVAGAWRASGATDACIGAGPVSVTICLSMPRRKSGHAGSPGRGQWDPTSPDIDSLVKSILDALTGLAWIDDAQVCELVATKHRADPDDGLPIGATISVEHAGPPGDAALYLPNDA